MLPLLARFSNTRLSAGSSSAGRALFSFAAASWYPPLQPRAPIPVKRRACRVAFLDQPRSLTRLPLAADPVKEQVSLLLTLEAQVTNCFLHARVPGVGKVIEDDQ